MHVGTLEIRLLIRESRSLKDKRQVVKSIMDRLRNGFNVSVAEVDARDHLKLAVLGVAMVGEEAGQVKGTLEQIANALRRHPVAEFVSCELSVVNNAELT
jgi:uncharacterized protein YlxP (DUF503 family)